MRRRGGSFSLPGSCEEFRSRFSVCQGQITRKRGPALTFATDTIRSPELLGLVETTWLRGLSRQPEVSLPES